MERTMPTPLPLEQESDDYFPQENPRLQRSHRHTTSWSASQNNSPFTSFDRSRAATIAPSLPPKQKRPLQDTHRELYKTQSLDNRNNAKSLPRRRQEESPYISVEDIASFPENTWIRNQHQSMIVKPVVMEETEVKPPPLAPGIRPRKSSPNNISRINMHSGISSSSAGLPPPSPTRRLASGQSDSLYTLPQKKSDDSKHFRPVSPMPNTVSMSPQSQSTESFTFSEKFHSNSTNTTPSLANRNYENTTIISELPPSYLQKKEMTFVADFNKIQNRLFRLYRKIEEAQEDSQMLTDLKTHLRLSEHDSVDIITEKMHMALAPPQEDDLEKKMMYVVDFRSFRDKFDLRHQIIEMFAKPGPPSISYAKVDAKMDGIITEFSARVTQLRETQGKLVESPAHARMILHGVNDGEQLVKALRDNQLWIRWGTISNLPPLSHLYLHKHPPSYEVRKAVTISFIAERLKSMPDMLNKVTSSNVLCPPIYSRLKSDSGKSKWQITEYNASTGKFDSHDCQLPSWLDDETTANSLMNSSNRTVFDLGNHPYALYSVYVVIIKDFTLAQEGITARNSDKDSSWATPSKLQYYIGSSSTGVLYRFARVENSHCDRIWKVLTEATSLRHFRCYEGCDLVEACLALAWARGQPRAVFVLNSFLPRNMSSLTLEQKAPFKEKMLALAGHLTDGKKIGPLCDMRYGMNGTTTIQDDEEY